MLHEAAILIVLWLMWARQYSSFFQTLQSSKVNFFGKLDAKQRHGNIQRLESYRDQYGEVTLRNRGGIEISEFNFDTNEDGTPISMLRGHCLIREVVIRNTLEYGSKKLICIDALNHAIFAHSFSLPLKILPKRHIKGFIYCNPSEVGYFQDILFFKFEGFNIGRPVHVHCSTDVQLASILRPITKYQVDNKNRKAWKCTEIIDERNEVYEETHRIPIRWKNKMDDGQALIILNKLKDINNFQSNYQELFHKLLWMEEYKMKENILIYNMYNITFNDERYFYSLPVPGLLEKKPSVLTKDTVLVKQNNAEKDECYRLQVMKVKHNHLLFGVSNRFDPSREYDLQFEINRIMLKRFHRSIDNATDHINNYYSYLFPKTLNLMSSRVDFNDDMKKRMSHLNEEQSLAVSSIVEGRCRTVPYIIFGPPGTGIRLLLFCHFVN